MLERLMMIEKRYLELDEELKNDSYVSRDQDLQLQKAIEYINEQL